MCAPISRMRKRVIAWGIAGAVLSGCGNTEGEVAYSATSPDGRVQAQLVSEGFGATVAEVSSVRLKAGSRDAGEVYRADHVRGLKLHWRDARNLDLEMDCGRVFHFSNFFDVLDEDGKLLYGVNVWLRNSALCSVE